MSFAKTILKHLHSVTLYFRFVSVTATDLYSQSYFKRTL